MAGSNGVYWGSKGLGVLLVPFRIMMTLPLRPRVSDILAIGDTENAHLPLIVRLRSAPADLFRKMMAPLELGTR